MVVESMENLTKSMEIGQVNAQDVRVEKLAMQLPCKVGISNMLAGDNMILE